MTTVSDRDTVVIGRPRYEGANVGTWIGFKHFMYLVEEAVLQWFREHGFAPGRLYQEHGLELEIVDSSVLLPAVLTIDDVVVATVTAQRVGRFLVQLRVERDGVDTPILRGTVTVALVRERNPCCPAARRPPPPELAELVVPEVAPRSGVRTRAAAGRGAPAAGVASPPGPPPFTWSWRASYVYCHYSDRVQHSAYVRALEAVVDHFLADRGLSIGAVLAERGWIPVVSRARVRLLADAYMEEVVHTTFVVEEVLRDTIYDGRMDCWVRRGNTDVAVATARILHGYAISHGEKAGELAHLDRAVVSALTAR